MEGVLIEHLGAAGGTISNGEGIEAAPSTINCQLEIPSWQWQPGIHTIQLQSPGGNTHLIDGFFVTTPGGGEEGETTLFYPTIGTGTTLCMPAPDNYNHLSANVSQEAGAGCNIGVGGTDLRQLTTMTTTATLGVGGNGEDGGEGGAAISQPSCARIRPPKRRTALKACQQESSEAGRSGASTTSFAQVATKFIQVQAKSQSSSLLPEGLSSMEDNDKSYPLRKCVVCLSRDRFTEDIFDDKSDVASNKEEPPVLQNMDILMDHLNLQPKGKPNEVGICLSCLDSLQRWHVFNCDIGKRHEDASKAPAGSVACDDSPLNCKPIKKKVDPNSKKISEVEEVYLSATHSYLARRNLCEKDWDFISSHLFPFNSEKKSAELKKYVTCREKLPHLFCTKCQRLVKKGKKGFVKHMKSQHPQDPVHFPCDICGNHLPDQDKGKPASAEDDYFKHWISHFYVNSCEECGKRFPTQNGLGKHRNFVHNKNRVVSQPSTTSNLGTLGMEEMPWKCDYCDMSFKMKRALVAHRDTVHFNIKKKYVCKQCGEGYNAATSLRAHMRRHEGRRDYKCEFCEKEFYTYSALKGHKIVHQTARDFICDVCGKGFKKRMALNEHSTLHTGVKPNKCSICGQEFRVKSNMYKHLKIHRKNERLGIPMKKRPAQTVTANTLSVTSSHSHSATQKAATPKKRARRTPSKKANRMKRVDTPIMLSVEQEPNPEPQRQPPPPINPGDSVVDDVVLEKDQSSGVLGERHIFLRIVTTAKNILETDSEPKAEFVGSVTEQNGQAEAAIL